MDWISHEIWDGFFLLGFLFLTGATYWRLRRGFWILFFAYLFIAFGLLDPAYGQISSAIWNSSGPGWTTSHILGPANAVYGWPDDLSYIQSFRDEAASG